MAPVATVEEYLTRHEEWLDALTKLRRLLSAAEFRNAGLEETIKWGAPCYVFNGQNVVGVLAFKAYFGLWFHQGALLADSAGVLVNAQQGKTRAQRQWRFTAADAIDASLVRQYIDEAIANAGAGRAIKPQKKPLAIPDELAEALDSDPALRERFEHFSPSCRREYAEYIAEAKRADTRQRRLAKILPMILTGSTLNARYR